MRHRVRAGDPAAFGELFDVGARRVYNHAYRLLGDWSAAEDTVSLTFLEAWRGRNRVQPEGGPLVPWLLGIATNVARNLARARRRHAAALDRLPQPRDEPDFADEVADKIDVLNSARAAQQALSALRRPEREVFALCVYAELDYVATAEALDIPVGTVRSRLSRARARLRDVAVPPVAAHEEAW
ncbi:RNA polymerase sigma factor [Cryptosporangium phraense]|uniref:RNA polymerase sigma factor n=1 Tax=Cryptosporangium phraense TaxID=2593070 RepID=A0A545AN18_9ACTN|nr:RNA polymerase sigma factor [Cryptosporangium phraense]